MNRLDDMIVSSDERLTLLFGELDIAYDERILTPRPWTLAQSHWASELLEDAPAGGVLELCAGAGHIGLHAVHRTARKLVLVDRDETACSYAQHNVVKAGRSGLCEVRQADLAEALQHDERFPIIIADPPWVPTASVGRFPEDPRGAIDGGPDGLDVTRACVQVIADHLSREGSAIVQLGSHAQSVMLADHVAERPDLDLRVVAQREFPGGVLVRLVRL